MLICVDEQYVTNTSCAGDLHGTGELSYDQYISVPHGSNSSAPVTQKRYCIKRKSSFNNEFVRSLESPLAGHNLYSVLSV